VIIVTNIRKTCDGCPSQWEGKTSEGQVIFAHYRSGRLRIGIGKTRTGAVNNITYHSIYGSPYDGSLTYQHLKDLTTHLFQWPDTDNNEEEKS